MNFPRLHHTLRQFVKVAILLIVTSPPTCMSNVEAAFHHVFTGTGALEVQLIAAKLALKSGDTCSIIGPSDSNHIKKCIALMYGEEAGRNYDDEVETEQNVYENSGMPKFVSDGDSIGQALATADGIIIVCEEKGVDDNFVDTLLSNTPNIKHLALLSRHGGKFKSMEDSIRKKCEELSAPSGNDVAFSILRAGNLVGGGPGGDVEKQGGEEWGLSKYFYDTKYDLSDAMITMSMDKFTLGARVTPGDPFKGPNFFSKMMSNSSFEPRDGDTGRTAAAHALLAAVRRAGDGVDVSISTEKSDKPPSSEEWDVLLERQ